MKVDPARRTNVSNTKRSKGTVKSTDLAFTSVLDAELRTEQSTANLKVSTVDALLPVESATADSDKEQASSRATQILDRLEDIRQGLLVGAISKPRLEELAGTIKETRASALDPVMSDILDEIELRAKIELAKFEDG
ncbi:MAG: flagellar assembly protein FliX [Pseudomonadota bacterium]|nr:flagellar assembly protein FliX [Pseudomonadota bacterium]